MPNQETELNEVEMTDGTHQIEQGDPPLDSAAPEAATVPAAGPVPVEETVSRAEFEQM